MVKLGQPPVNESQLSVLMVNHDVVWLHVSVSDPFRMTVVQSLQGLVYVVPYVEVGEVLIQSSKVNISGIHVLHDEGRCLCHWVSDNVNQVDNVDSALQSLEDLDFPSDLGFLDRLQDFNDNAFVVGSVDSFVNF